MHINVKSSPVPPPADRAYVLSIVIRSFKGRRNVEVHLFRPDYSEAELDDYDWDRLIGEPIEPGMEFDPLGSRKVLLEAFTEQERDMLVEYLKNRYESRLAHITAMPMEFPIPLGLTPLSSIPEGKSIGFIRFDQIPNYTLPFAVHGLYDLAQHEPIVQGEG